MVQPPFPMFPFHLRVFDTSAGLKTRLLAFLDRLMTWKPNLNPTVSHPFIHPRYIMVKEGEKYDKITKKTIRSHFHCYLDVFPALVKDAPNLQKTHIEIRELFKTSFPTLSGNKSYSLQKQKNNNLLSYILKEIDREKPLDQQPIEFYRFTLQDIQNVPIWIPKKQLFKQELHDHMVSWANIHTHNHPTHLIPGVPRYYIDACIEILKWCREKHRFIPRSQYSQICYDLGIITPYEFLSLNHII